jgi:integrase
MIFGFLKWCGVATKPLAPDGPPSFVKKKTKSYSRDELGVFMASLKKQYHKVVYNTFMPTGMWEQEVMYLEPDSFDFKNFTVSVLARDDNGFLIKDRAERTIPLNKEVAVMVREWIKGHRGRYVFGTSKGKVNGELLPTLKRMARRAGLNCGRCKTCMKPAQNPAKKAWKQQQCSRWLLKTFMSTWITTLSRSGRSVETIMSWSGHEDYETIKPYLVPSEARDVQDNFNSIVWTVPPIAG